MKPGHWLAAALTISLAAPVLAADGDKTAEAPKEKKVCRIERTTGSLINQRRICMTQAEWDKLALETKKDVEDIQRNAGSIPRTAGANGAGAGMQ